MNTKTLIAISGIAVALTLLFSLSNVLLGLSSGFEFSGWSLLSNLLVALVLGWIILAARTSGWSLALLVLLVYFVIGHFNILIEAYIFKVTDQGQTLLEMLRGFIVCLVISPIAVYLLSRWNHQETTTTQVLRSRSWFSWGWRLILGILLYFVFYATAGMTLQAVYPKFMEFYTGKVPELELIFKVQIFRGLVFVGIAILLLSQLRRSRWKKALLLGLIFSIFGGIAPLIPPNDLMPAYVRLAHGFEVGISNFLYGVVLGLLLSRKS